MKLQLIYIIFVIPQRIKEKVSHTSNFHINLHDIQR